MASTTNYFNGSRKGVKKDHPGYGQSIFIAAARWFDEMADVDGALGEDAVTISDDHTFLVAGGAKEPSGGFVELYATPNTPQGTGTNGGDAGSLVGVYKNSFFVPGDDPAFQQMMEKLKNDDLIVLLQDPIDGDYVQYGNNLVQAHFDKCDFVSGTLNSGKKGYNIEISSPNRYFYKGTVTKMA